MPRFRLRKNRLERELRAAAPKARPEFVAALAEQVKPQSRRRARVRVVVAVGVIAAALASVVALGAPGYVRAAASAVQQTATSLAGSSTAGPNGKTTICHRTGSLTNPFVQITVSNSALPAHTAHGDIIPVPTGGCPTSLGSGGDQYGNGVPICHRTGSATNPYVLIVVAPSAVPAHQAHGDIVPAPPSGCPQGSPKTPDSTSVTVQAPATFSVGDDAVFTVRVTSNGATQPQGDVICLDNGDPFDRAPVQDGAATCDETFDAEGSHVISATFQSSDTGFWTNASSTTAQTTVARGATTVTVTSSGSPSAAGSAVTFSATVAPVRAGAASPTGTVQFLDDTTPIGAPATLSGGHASLSVPSPASGSHTITAVYAGDVNYGIATSGPLTQVVSASTTSLGLATASGTIAVGTPVTISTTLGSADGTHPQGGITFTDNGNAFASLAPNTATTSVTWTPTTTGSHVITAAFASANNAKWTDSRSTSATVVVGSASSATTVTSSASPAAAGSTVTLTATVTSSASGIAAPSGTVKFLEGATTLGTSTLAGGSATISLSSLAVGAHTVTAVYAGDSLYAGSTSAALSQQIVAASVTLAYTGPTTGAYGQPLALSSTGAPAGSTVTYATPAGTVSAAAGATATITPNWTGAKLITVSYAGDATHLAASTSATITIGAATSVSLAATPASAAYGQSVTLTAKVTASGATLPAGSTVTFTEGSTTLGTATLDSSGNGSLALSTFAVGAHTVTASYGGNAGANILPASASATVTVQGLPTSIAYTGPTTAAGGQTLTLTASTSGIPNGATITFALPGGTSASGTVSSGTISASTTVSWTPLSGTTITVSYAGDTTHAASSTTGTITLVQHPVTLALSTSANPLAANQSLTYGIQLSAADGSTPAGTVTITDNGATIGSATLKNGDHGSYTVSLTASSPGAHTIVASFATSDSSHWSSTSTVLIETITKPAVTVSLSTSNANANPGSSVTFTATVLPVVRVTASPTGTVTFLDGSVAIGSATVNGSGVAALTTSTLAPGPHTITASYGGDATYDGGSSGGLAQTVVQTPTTTTVTTSDSSATAGESLTFTATVLAGSSPLTAGSVQFSSDGTTLGSAPVGAGGIATFTTAALGGGTHTIAATYVPASAVYLASSGTVSQAVAAPATALSLAAGTLRPTVGASVTITATVTSGGAAVTSGNVVFAVDGTVVGTVAVDSHGQAQLTTSSLGAAGSHLVAAAFVGNPPTSYIPSVGTLTLTVGP